MNTHLLIPISDIEDNMAIFLQQNHEAVTTEVRHLVYGRYTQLKELLANSKQISLSEDDINNKAHESWKKTKGYIISGATYSEAGLSGGYYYDLFKFFSDAHGLTLVDTEISDIIAAVEQFKENKKL